MSAEIKKFTSRLIAKNKEIQHVIDGIGGMLMILTPDMEIINMNKKGVKALNKKKYEIYGKKCYEILLGNNQICKGCLAQEALNSEEVKFSRIIINQDIFQNTYYPAFSKGEDSKQIIVQSQKITKRVMLEKELAQSEKMSEIGQLTSAIAHEIKNPLAVIKGSSYLLSASINAYEDSSAKENLESIIRSTIHAEEVVYHLLDFSKPVSEYVTRNNITKILEQVILLTNRNRIKNDVEIITKFNPNPLFYNGPAEPIKHVFMNLISNGINAMKMGGIIKISAEYLTPKEEEILLVIEDNGPGIKKEFLNKIFEPFTTTDTSGVGTGMGLWLTKIMIEKMEGNIQVESVEGKGTKFTITLPMVDNERNIKNDI